MRHNKRTAGGSAQTPFSFLSILICVIGTLCLLILGLNLMASVTAHPIIPDEGKDNLKKAQLSLADAQERIKKAQEEMKRLQSQKDETEAQRKKLEQTRKDMVEQLAKVQRDRGEKSDDAKVLSDEGKRLMADKDLLTSQGGKLDQDLREAEGFIKACPTGEKDKEGRDVLAPMIECCAGKLVIHAQHLPNNGRKEIPIASPDAESNEELSSFLKDFVAKYEKPTVFFIIRPGGADTFRMARAVAQSESQESRKIRYGCEVFTDKLQVPTLY